MRSAAWIALLVLMMIAVFSVRGYARRLASGGGRRAKRARPAALRADGRSRPAPGKLP